MTKRPKTNKYCALRDLTNESAVEQFFVIRLLKDLGFDDSEILTKTSIKELVIGRGRKKENYKPDYAIKLKNKVRLLIDAKDPKESVDSYFYQISGYALNINQEYDSAEKPVKLCILTNGVVINSIIGQTINHFLSLSLKIFLMAILIFPNCKNI